MAETKTSRNRKKGRPAYSCKHFKMTVMADQSADTVKDIAKEGLDYSARVKTDNARGFSKLSQVVKTHKARTVKPKQAGKELPWVHIAISNAKRNLLNTYHHIDDSYLQNYLDEGFFTTVDFENRGKHRRKLKRGRGSENQTPVMVMAESKKSTKRNKGRPSYSCGHFKMEAMTDLTSNTVETIAQKSLDPNCQVKTDNFPGYMRLNRVVKTHTAKTIKPKDADKELPWVHITIAMPNVTF
jgi:hypothetical protein